MNFDAEVSVVQAGGTEFKLLHNAKFKDDGDDTRHRSSVAISQGNLFVRTGTKLFCLGSDAAALGHRGRPVTRPAAAGWLRRCARGGESVRRLRRGRPTSKRRPPRAAAARARAG